MGGQTVWVNIGKIGVWTSYRPFGVDRAAEAARLVEQLGYGAFWLGGSPKVADVRPILEATSTLVAATGILNVWSNEPGETAAADAALREEFPGRFMLGVGIGHPEATSDYRRPLKTMRAFLDGLDAAPTPPPTDQRCLAALGPKMLELAAERTAGSHLYFVSVEHTRFARARLGADKLVAPELACVVDSDSAHARGVARDYARLYLGLRNYTRRLLDSGFSDADLRRRRLRPADRPGRAPRKPRADRRGCPRAPRRWSQPRLPAAARRGGHPRQIVEGARERPDRLVTKSDCGSTLWVARRRRGWGDKLAAHAAIPRARPLQGEASVTDFQQEFLALRQAVLAQRSPGIDAPPI
jgi:probable F420-dependent oxidoreductase